MNFLYIMMKEERKIFIHILFGGFYEKMHISDLVISLV